MKPLLTRAALPILAASLLLGSAPLASAQESAPSEEAPSAEDWKSIRQAYEGTRHALRETDDGHCATNYHQQLNLEFDGCGVSVSPRDEGQPSDGPWSWGLQLESYGFRGHELRAGPSPTVDASGQRLTYRWSESVDEWFINDTRGLEHGFTLHERPQNRAQDSTLPLVFTLGLTGKLLPEVNQAGRTATFTDAAGRTVLQYSGLQVFDAAGEDLPARMEVEAGRLRIVVDEVTATYPLTIDPVVQQGYLKASSPDIDDLFGGAVAASGNTVAVGARGEDSNATGVNGNASNNSASNSGAVYVFVRTGSTWAQEAYLKPLNTGGSDAFGLSLDLDGDTLIVGALFERSNATGVNGDASNNSAPSSGAAYIFERTAGAWSQQAYLKASNTGSGDRFGFSVGVDGDTAVVGAIFEASGASGVNGDETDNSVPNTGAAYVYTRLGPNWTQQAYLKASDPSEVDRFGISVGVSGDTVVVGAMSEDSAATGIDGDPTDNSSTDSGAAYVYFRSGTNWTQQAYLKSSNSDAGDNFGREVAIFGDTIVVAAPFEDSNASGVGGDQSDNSFSNAGAVYVFGRTAGVWGQLSYLKSPSPDANDSFGSAVDISNDLILVGVDAESSSATGVDGDWTDNGTVRSGAAFVYAPCGSEWAVAAYLKAVNPDIDDALGREVAIDGGTVILAAHREDSNATGVDGDPFNNSASDTGAAYVFDLDLPLSQFCGFPDHCNGDGGDQAGCSDCACSNNAAPGTIGGCLNSNASSARLLASGDPSISLPASSTTDLRFALEGAMPSVFSALFSGSSLAPVSPSQPCFGLNSGALSPAFDGLRCASLGVLRHGNRGTDIDGRVGFTNSPWGGEGNPVDGIAQAGSGFAAGQVRYFQVVYRDDPALSCMTGLNTTQAVEVTFVP